MTSQTYDGDLKSKAPGAASGLDGADALCQLAADAAVLGGKFKAYVGTTAASPESRLNDVGPWFLVDKGGATEKVFNNKANMATQPLIAFDHDERGELVEDPSWTWTGVNGPDCEGWTKSPGGYTGAMGFTRAKNRNWRDNGPEGAPCNRPARLYCFEQ